MTETGAASDLMVVFCELKQWERTFIEGQPASSGWDMRFYDAPVDELPDYEKAAVEVLSCFIRSRIDAGFLEQCPNLKLIATRSVGHDHIDLAACEERGVVVSNVPRYGENTVAEHTFGLILALSRNIYAAVDRAKRGDMSIEGLLGFDLHGKTLGIVGAGRIGLHVIRIGTALNMRVLAHDPDPQPLLAEVMGFEYVELDDLLAQADVVSIHVPLLPGTYHMLDAEKLALMKPSAILVNTSRGAVVDSKALLEALDEARLAGAAVDVLEGEHVITEDRVMTSELSLESLQLAVEAYQLMHHPRVIVTSHIAFYSREALERILLTALDNIVHFVQSGGQNVVARAE